MPWAVRISSAMEQKVSPRKRGSRPDDHARAGGLLRDYVAGDSGHGAADIGEGKFVRHDGSPAGSSKMNFCGHINLPITTGCYPFSR